MNQRIKMGQKMSHSEMTQQRSRKYEEIKKRGAEIVRSLLSEGYILVSQSNACETVTLRHSTNGNRMFIRCGSLGVWVFKNRRLVKIELI